MKVDTETLRARLEQRLREHKGKYIFQGTVFIILGILAVALPATTALSVELMIGVVLLLSGILQLVLTLKSSPWLASPSWLVLWAEALSVSV